MPEIEPIWLIEKRCKRRDELQESMRLYPADIMDYEEWLLGYIQNGGKITHHYDYPFERQADNWYQASFELTVKPLYGASSVNIIIPKGVSVTVEDRGHNNLYYLDGFKIVGSFVPGYSDINLNRYNIPTNP